MDVTERVRLARAAYLAYGDRVGWLNHRGQPMPLYDALDDGIRSGWEAAALAVVETFSQEFSRVVDQGHRV
jgi:hypothetical protein